MKAYLYRMVPQGVLSMLIALCVALAAATAAADTHYVSLAGHAVSPYASWYDAATNIAPQVMTAVQNGDTIVVSNGTYYNTNTVLVNGKSLTITSLYGAASTILDGSQLVPNAIWPYGFYVQTNLTLYGFTITNFSVAAILNRDNGFQICTLINCVFVGNHTYPVGTTYGSGTTIMSNCVVSGNTGGGIYFYAKQLQIDNSVISSNQITGTGGGIYVQGATVGVVIRSSTISSNKSSSDGGGINCNVGSLSNCYIINNFSTNGNGGGLAGAMTLDNCVITNNTAKSSGGGISGTSIIRNSTVSSNTAATGSGGGISGAGGASVSGCKVLGNYAQLGGGGIYNCASVRNCLVANNRAVGSDSSGQGGGISSGGVVANCTVVSNRSDWASGGVFRSYCVNSIIFFNTCNPGVSNYWQADTVRMPWTNCCTAPDPATVTIGGTNCITTDPKLVNMPADCRLLKGSPCINAGTNQSWMNTDVDLGGHTRIVDGTVDMGAYEWFPKGTVVKFH